MPKHRLPRRFDRAIFDAHLIPEMESGTRLSFRFLQREEEELNRAVEDEFRANYQEEYQRACAQAEEKWYPYRDAGIIDDQQEYQYRWRNRQHLKKPLVRITRPDENTIH